MKKDSGIFSKILGKDFLPFGLTKAYHGKRPIKWTAARWSGRLGKRRRNLYDYAPSTIKLLEYLKVYCKLLAFCLKWEHIHHPKREDGLWIEPTKSCWGF